MIPHSKPTIGMREQKAVAELLSTGQLAAGNSTALFSAELREALKVNHFFLTSTGTTAEIILLKALNIGKGQEVILPSYVCKSVYEAVLAVEAIPVLCDINEKWVMSYEAVLDKLTERTGAVILVHIFGIDAWDQRFADLNVPVLEDFCQAFGLRSGESSTLRGLAGFYSFHATKCLTTGEGGGISVNDTDLAANITRLLAGENRSRFSDYQSVLGLVQTEQYTEFLSRRKEIADHYFSELPEEITAAFLKSAPGSVFFRFPLRIASHLSAELQDFLSTKNIAARKGVDTLLHKSYNHNSVLPVTEKVFEETLCLPIYPSLTDQEMKHISGSVNQFFKASS